MNEQPQPGNLQPNSREGGQPLYKPVANGAPSTFNGYDLAHDATPVQPPMPAPVVPVQPPQPQPIAPLPTPAAPVTSPVAPVAQEDPLPEPSEPQPQGNAPIQESTVDLHWEASEYIHHTKGFTWYLVYALVMVGLLALAYFVTHSWTFMALVVVMSIALGIYANRPPRTLHYGLTNSGIQIEQATYKYSDFRAFGILNDGALYSIMLIPAKRFLPAVSIYFAEEDGEHIVDILGTRLPMEEIHLDVVDRLVRRLRF